VFIAREWQNWRDRKDLLDRIMSVDYREYKTIIKPNRPPSANVRMGDEELARQEQERGKKC
jgi:hypothetical protein